MKNLIIVLLLFLSINIFCQTSLNQEDNTITIKGITTNSTVYEETSRLENVTIHIYEYNKKITSYNSDSKGKFEFTIPKNSYIVLVFEKNNFISKKILFDTRTNAKTKKIKPFDLEVVMLEYIKGVDYSDLDFPITRVEYQEEYNDYNYAEKYTKMMMKKQEKVLSKMARKLN
jgi:hypothetical protein